jgi:high-affinity iron transporter
MVSALIIVFREVLEMALVIGIVLAATRGLPRRMHWIGLGVVGGIAGSTIVAVLSGHIAELASGMGQELFHATILFAAASLLIWTVIWMTRHGRQMTIKARQVGQSLMAGELPARVLALVVGFAVLREGSEIVLFLYGTASAGHGSSMAIAYGSLLGFGLGVMVAYVTYQGLVHIPLRHVFSVTGWLLTLLAAGMLSQGVGYLVMVEIVPALGQPIWDSSRLLPESGWPGQILHVLIGYEDRPSGIQLLIFSLALMVTAYFRSHLSSAQKKDPVQRPATTGPQPAPLHK